MPTKSINSDRQRVSSQAHEITYAARSLGKNGRAKVQKAKKALGRTTSRAKVMARAKSSR